MGYNTNENKADMQRINETLVKHWHKTINEFDKRNCKKVIAVVENKFIQIIITKPMLYIEINYLQSR